MYICSTTAMTVVIIIIQTKPKFLKGIMNTNHFGSNHHNINIIFNAYQYLSRLAMLFVLHIVLMHTFFFFSFFPYTRSVVR